MGRGGRLRDSGSGCSVGDTAWDAVRNSELIHVMANTTHLSLMIRQSLQLVLLPLCLAASVASAQGIGTSSCSVGLGFDCSLVEGREGSGPEQRHWLRAVVIWKSGRQDSPAMRDTAAARTRMQRFLLVQRAAEDAGRVLVGVDGVAHRAPVTMTWGFRPNVPDSVFVLNRAFELPSRDSALVLLIDARGDGEAPSPQLLATTWMPAAIDPGFWPKQWRSGDTTFIVSPRRGNRILQDSLVKAPAVRAFLSEPH